MENIDILSTFVIGSIVGSFFIYFAIALFIIDCVYNRVSVLQNKGIHYLEAEVIAYKELNDGLIFNWGKFFIFMILDLVIVGVLLGLKYL